MTPLPSRSEVPLGEKGVLWTEAEIGDKVADEVIALIQPKVMWLNHASAADRS